MRKIRPPPTPLQRVAGERSDESAIGRKYSLAAFFIHLHAASVRDVCQAVACLHRRCLRRSNRRTSRRNCATRSFRLAASILLRPLPQPGQPDQSSAGLDGKYLVIKRLLPFFEQFAPAEMVESLRGHLNALNSLVSDNTAAATMMSGSTKALNRTSLRPSESSRCWIESIARRLPPNAIGFT